MNRVDFGLIDPLWNKTFQKDEIFKIPQDIPWTTAISDWIIGSGFTSCSQSFKFLGHISRDR